MKRQYVDRYAWVDEVVHGPRPNGQKSRKRLKAKVRTKPPKGQKAPSKYRLFLTSIEWKQVRYAILLRDKGTCQACGESRANGARLNVDHIKPLHSNWELRLDPENLQVLCSKCNAGKGTWDATDWRDPLTEAYKATLAET
jgi:hypothetical protein